MPDTVMSAEFQRALRPLLLDAVASGVTPGAQLALSLAGYNPLVIAVGTLDGTADRSVTVDTVYDLASLTKPLTALAAVRLAESGVLLLDEPIGALWPQRFAEPIAALRLDALLSHRAGLPGWVAAFESVPLAECGSSEARARVLDVVAAVPLTAAGTALYSDLGYILAGEAMAQRAGATVDAVVRQQVITPLGLGALRWRGVGERWRDASVAPTERCPWRRQVVQGEVHDENAYALGGIAGHAGLFGTATAIAALGRACLTALRGESAWMSARAVEAMIVARSGGTHRLGWDGVSAGASSSGQHFGPRAFGHLGFTGTSVWCEPDRDLVVALVTNRVHPSRESVGIRALRPQVHDAIIDLLRRNP